MSTPLVVGTDGSDDALRAVDWAADEAALRGCPLRLLHASLWESYATSAMPTARNPQARRDAAARQVVAGAEERVRQRRPEVTVSGAVREEDPVHALVDASDHAAMVVVGSQGHGLSGVVLGSVSLTVAAQAHCPVAVVRTGRDTGRVGGQWAVLGLAAPHRNPAAADFAFAEAALHGYGVTVVHATVRVSRSAAGPAQRGQEVEDWLDAALARSVAGHPDVPVRRVVVAGRAHPALLAATKGAELLVLGARRRANPLGPQLGPVNHAMLHQAPCTVVIVPVQPAGG
ncbi:stress-inducible protein [Streptomyces noursei ATCC 11455]|uniref:universal stress protein n=1 Tax=Streptomyces noursei TaxID=1971 RepID=UPI00081CF7B9|nr:stress-inducible protein [Streptomyces noursei ATCC 11455]